MKRESFDDFCRACLDLLKSQRAKFMVVGGVAVTVVGEPRFTADLDVIAFLDVKKVELVVRAGLRRGFTANVAAEMRAARDTGTVRLARGPYHFDLILNSFFIEDLAYERSRPRRVFARTARFPAPEDLLILKIVAGRGKDLLDAEGIIQRHGRKLDRRYVERVLTRAFVTWRRIPSSYRAGSGS